MKINRITPDEHIFTQRLDHIADPPESLYYIGKLPTTEVPVVSIVGTRKPTSYGKEIAYRLAHDLAKRGVVIISGLALGIDGIAHRAALEAGGTTLGVVVNKLPDISPRTNVQLARQIVAKGGAIISEWSEDDTDIHIGKWSFLHRNRLVSGLSDAVIVIEAAARSGTLNTAGHALTQGREVFAVPGNVTSPMSEGCNNLLRQGAHPATKAEDILEVIAPNLASNTAYEQRRLPIGNNAAENTILKLIHQGMRDGDEIMLKSNLPASEFATTMTMLEIDGVIKPLGANQWTLC